MSDESSQIPVESRVPRGELWACLLAPPFAAAAGLAVAFAMSSVNMDWLPLAAISFAVAVLLGCLIRLLVLMSRKYPPGQVILLAVLYLAGQGAVACAVLFGACILSLGR